MSGAAGDKEEGRGGGAGLHAEGGQPRIWSGETLGDSERYDFILDTGTRLWRVQVKSSSALQNGGYCVNAQRHANGNSIAYRTGEIDFLIAQIVPEDCWYVIPLEAILPRKSLRIYPEKDARVGEYGKYREAWDLIR